MTTVTWHALLALVAGVAGVAAATPLVIRLAHRLGWVAHPKADRWHRRPTALMGGVGIFAGATLAALAAWTVGVRFEPGLGFVMAGAALMFGTGVVDDRLALRPTVKLLFQIAAAVLALWGGVGFAGWPLWIGVPRSSWAAASSGV